MIEWVDGGWVALCAVRVVVDFQEQGIGTGGDRGGGQATLISPTFDLTAFSDPRIGYWRWYSNTAGASPNAVAFEVKISNNGGIIWASAETVNPCSAA